MRDKMFLDLRKWPDIICLSCKKKGRYGRMRAKIFETSLGPMVRYACLEGCVVLVKPEEVKDEQRLENNMLIFEKS